MRGLDGSDVLRLYERGHALDPVEQGLLLLEHAWPEAEPDHRAALPLGERDRLLMVLRASTFGGEARVRASCPECGAELEAGIDLGRLVDAVPAGDEPFGVKSFHLGGREIRFRPPSSSDLLDAMTAGDAGGLRLLARCIEEVDGVHLEDAELRRAFAAAIAEADPLVEVELELGCSECGHAWTDAFDVVSFFWTEIEAHARRLFLEVHTLATAYGWTEAQILALSPARRRIYLGMVSP